MTEFALITGASMGLGRAFAYEMARRGYDLILVCPMKGLKWLWMGVVLWVSSA